MVNKDVGNKIWLFTHDNKLSYAKGDSIYLVDSFKYASPINITLRISLDTLLVITRFMDYNFYLTGIDKYTIVYYTSLSKEHQKYFNRVVNTFNSVNYDSISLLLGHTLESNNNFNSGYSITFNNSFYGLSSLNNVFYTVPFNEKNGFLLKAGENNRFYWPVLKDSNLLLSGTDGLRVFNRSKLIKEYSILSQVNIFRSYEDVSCNVWSGTQNSGAYFFNLKLTSKIKTKNYFNFNLMYSSRIGNETILETDTKKLLFLDTMNQIKFLVENSSGLRESGVWFDNLAWARGNNNHKLYELSSRKVIDFFSFNKSLSKIDSNFLWKPYFSHQISLDSIISINSNECRLITKMNDIFKVKIIFNNNTRIFTSYLDNNKYFHVSTLNNLYFFDRYLNIVDSVSYINDSSKLSVSTIFKFLPYNLIIVGTNGQGIYLLTDKREWKKIEKSYNLEIKSIFSLNNYLIAHTNKGIFSYINKDGEFKFNTVYANSYGLNPDDIKLVYPYHDSIHVVTKNSILAFSPSLIDTTQDTLRVYECLVDNRKVSLEKTVVIPHDFKQLSFRFSTFNYTRMDDTKFRYRFNSSDPWIVLSSNLIELSQLASGDYNLEIEAFNKYSNEVLASAVVPMKVLTPWWKTLEFIVLSNIIFLALVSIPIRRYYQRRNLAQTRIARLESDLNELRLKALEGQMNPHFIFNSLTAIQFYIQENQLQQAEHYLTQFSKLIRSYLEAARQSTIALEDEINLLSKYIELEQMRFENKFEFELDIKTNLLGKNIEIPTMLIQPFVENAIRHGLFHRKKDGKLKLQVYAKEKDLFIHVTDNGIGIDNAKMLGTKTKKDNISRAMQIFNEKIDVFNNIAAFKIRYSVSNLNDSEPQYKGTNIEIVIENILMKNQDEY